MGPYATARDCTAKADTIGRARSHAGRPSVLTTDRRAILTRTVERDVIPRLLANFPVARNADAAVVTPGDVTALAEITLGAHEAATAGFVTGQRERGVAAQAVYLDLLTPAARLLGQWWVDDVCDFTQVTIGLWRLQGAMREISPAFLGEPPARATRPSGARALLVPLPGEQHTFGLSMVHDFFRRAGWNAWSGPVADRAELAGLVAHQWVDVVGFSLACDERLDQARQEIRAVRGASRNPGLAVMVGGPPFVENPHLAAEIGADGTAENGLQAVAAAAALMRRAEARR